MVPTQWIAGDVSKHHMTLTSQPNTTNYHTIKVVICYYINDSQMQTQFMVLTITEVMATFTNKITNYHLYT